MDSSECKLTTRSSGAGFNVASKGRAQGMVRAFAGMAAVAGRSTRSLDGVLKHRGSLPREAPMSEMGITAALAIAVAGFAWLIYRVVATLPAGGSSASRADINAAGALPGSEQIDSAMERAKASARVRYGNDI